MLLAVITSLSLLSFGGGSAWSHHARAARLPLRESAARAPPMTMNKVDLGGEGVPTMGDSMAGLEMLQSDPEGMLLLQQMQKSPKLMNAVMELALRGDDAMPDDDEELSQFLSKLQEIALRQNKGSATK